MTLGAFSLADGSAELSYRVLLSQLVGARMGAKKPMTLFLGAGCSLTSATAGDKAVASTRGIIASLVDEWLCKPESANLSDTALWEQFYALWIKQGLEQRRRDIAQRLEGLEPSPGYFALARMASQGCFRAIITTNFDLLLDRSLENVPHDTQVGTARLEPAPNGGVTLQLLKVHGDIRRGGLLFEPRQLHQLPEALAQKVRDLTEGPTLVVGYQGQDHGIMSSLCADPAYNAFWASPRPPTYDQEYHYAPVLDWMQSRNSRSNFLFGDTLGKFDELFVRLEDDLNAAGARAYIVPLRHENFVLASLRTSPRLSELYDEVCGTIAAEYQDTASGIPAPFAAPSPSEARQSLANCLNNSIVSGTTGLVLRNEMESLAFALAIEVSAYVGLGTSCAAAFVMQCQEAHNRNCRSIQIGSTIWELVVALLDGDDRPIPPAELRVHFNGKTQLTLLSESTEPTRLKTALRLLHGLCWLAKGEIAPSLLETEFAETLISLRNKVREASHLNAVAVVKLDSITADEVSLLKTNIPVLSELSSSGDRPFVLAGGPLRIEARQLYETSKPSGDDINSLAEAVRISAATSVRAFLAIPDPYGTLRRDSVRTSLDAIFKRFSTTHRPGLVIVGESGTGKTSALRRFVVSCIESGNCHVIVRTPRTAGITPSFDSLFFPLLAEAPQNERHRALSSLNGSLEQHGETLYLVLDGINEFDGDLDAVKSLYRDMLEFNAFLSQSQLSRIKTVTTTRSHFFVTLCRACSPPPPDYFYSEANGGDRDAAFVRVLPLNAQEIEGIARLYFRAEVAPAFLDLLRNIPRLAKDYSHPVLLAVAGHVIQSPEEVGSLRRSATLFQRFADEMIERLGDADQQHKAIETIHAYFDVQLQQQSSGVITEFALSKGLGRAASEVVRQISDAHIFRISERGTVYFSHDRIAEHFLGHYLLHNLHRPVIVASVFRKTAENALYFGGLVSLVSRLLSAAVFDGGRECLDRLHDILRGNVLAEGGPTSELVIEALGDFAKDDRILELVDRSAPDRDEFRQSLANGLWRAAERHMLGELLEHFSGYCESLALAEPAHSELCCALSQAALSDSTDANSGSIAQVYLGAISTNGLQACGPIWRDRYRTARAKLARQTGQVLSAIQELSDLYRNQLKEAAWSHAATTALELGRAYRDNTQIHEALSVYAGLAEHVESLGEPMASRLALQTATVEKNIVQQLVRTGRDTQEILPHFESALRSLEAARQRSRAARLVIIEIEAAVERVELFLAAQPVIGSSLQLAREACLEVAQLLSFHPNHRQLVAFRRQLAKIACLEARYEDAIAILEDARRLAESTHAFFYAADCDYQLGHMIAQSEELSADPVIHAKGVAALQRAITFYERNCAPGIEYKSHCIEALARLAQ